MKKFILKIVRAILKRLLETVDTAIAAAVIIAVGITVAIIGCRHITIEKRDPIAYPTPTNTTVLAEGGYEFSYWNCGLKTDIDSIKADKGKETVKVEIGKVSTDVSDKHAEVVTAGGEAIGDIAEKVIEGIKGIETIKLQTDK